jgi:hypothetical protein
MTWTKLRPMLREQFGNSFSFFNDKYKSGKRRIKIGVGDTQDVIGYIKSIAPELDVKQYKMYTITIHYNK